MTIQEQLHQLVDQLDDETASEVLSYTRWLVEDERERLTPEEIQEVLAGDAEIVAGESVSLDELRRRLPGCTESS